MIAIRTARRRFAVVTAGASLALALTGCSGVGASPAGPEHAATAVPSHPVMPPTPTSAITNFPLSSVSAPPLDPAAAQAALAQLADATVPPGARESPTAPPGDGVRDMMTPRCAPEADESAYWELPGMDPAQAAAWLQAHPSKGLQVSGYSGSSDIGMWSVIESVGIPTETPSDSVLVFTINPAHSGGAVIKADSISIQANAVCTQQPGVTFAFGG